MADVSRAYKKNLRTSNIHRLQLVAEGAEAQPGWWLARNGVGLESPTHALVNDAG